MSTTSTTGGHSLIHGAITRRRLLEASAGVALAAVGGSGMTQGATPARPKEIRIAYQRGGIFIIAQQQRVLEKFFQPLGVEIV